MIKKNPCRYCALAFEDRYGRHYPSFQKSCKCKNRISYEEFLKTKRIFEAGEIIKDFETLMQQDFVIWHGMTRHREFIMSNQTRIVKKWLDDNSIRKAIKKGGDS